MEKMNIPMRMGILWVFGLHYDFADRPEVSKEKRMFHDRLNQQVSKGLLLGSQKSGLTKRLHDGFSTTSFTKRLGNRI